MIFTENRYDRSIERMMTGIPNFYPRGSGIVVTGNFRYTAEKCDFEYCGCFGNEKGIRDITSVVLISLTKLYGVSAEYILGLKDSPD